MPFSIFVFFILILPYPLNAIAQTPRPNPQIIGHRGSPAHLPEHTLEGYRLAVAQGADYIEPDLVMTKDGVLIARHENNIAETTDVSEKFPARRREKTVDGKRIIGWFTEDFTLAEVRQLRAKERLPFRDHSHDGLYSIPTFEEILIYVQTVNASRSDTDKLKICPEIKHSTYFKRLKLEIEGPLLELLARFGYRNETSPVVIQSFEISNLEALHRRTSIHLAQLIGDPWEGPWDKTSNGSSLTYRDMLSRAGLRAIKRYAFAVSPAKEYLQRRNHLSCKLVRQAHRLGLEVHVYTFRPENQFMHRRYHGNAIAELQSFASCHVDAIFADAPDVAKTAFATSP